MGRVVGAKTRRKNSSMKCDRRIDEEQKKFGTQQPKKICPHLHPVTCIA